MSLRHSYTLFAPIYDLLLESVSRPLRAHNLGQLQQRHGQRVLLVGIGSGLDIPLLPPGPHYVGMDLTPAMLQRARQRRQQDANISLHLADAMRLPYGDASFDAIVMHLILAVVPQPQLALAEACRVLKPGGDLLILDKFLRPDQRAWLRRLVSPMLGRIATRTDVELEPLLARHPELQIITDRKALAGGWFRQLRLNKNPVR